MLSKEELIELEKLNKEFSEAAEGYAGQSGSVSCGKGNETLKIRPAAGGSGLFIPDFLNKGSGVTIIKKRRQLVRAPLLGPWSRYRRQETKSYESWSRDST